MEDLITSPSVSASHVLRRRFSCRDLESPRNVSVITGCGDGWNHCRGGSACAISLKLRL